MSTSTFDLLLANVEGALEFAGLLDELLAADTLEDLDVDLIDTLADHGYEDVDGSGSDDPLELVDELIAGGILEVYGTARVTFDTVDVREVVAVVGVGGPHIEFAISYNGRVVARGWWGSDKVERGGSVDRLGDYLAEVLGGWDR